MPNYTISTFQITETQGDAVFFATMFTAGQFVITPDDGYVVYATDFSHGALPDTVASAAFTDSTTAGAVDNTVICTCQLNSQLELTSSLLPIIVPITGHARVFVGNETTREQFTIQLHDKNYDINKGVTSVTAEAGITKTVSTVNGVYIHQLHGVVDVNVPTKVASISYITNSSSDPHYITVEPYLTHIGIDSDKVYYVFTDVVSYDNGDAYIYTFDIMINTNIPLDVDNNERMFVNHLYAQRETSATTEITNVVHGPIRISPTGETRPIIVYGDPGAEFDLTVTKDRDNSSILSAANANTTISDGIYGSISAIRKKLESAGNRSGLASFTFNQSFPAHTPVLTDTVNGARSNDAYVIIDGSTSTLRVGDRVRDTAGTEILSGTWITITEIVSGTRVSLSGNITVSDGVGIKFFREEKYYINLFPVSGTTLGTNIPNVTPHYTLEQYHASNPTLTLSATNSSDSGSIADITYVGRANEFPSKLKHTLNGSTDFFQISYSLTAASGSWRHKDSTLPKWSSTDSAASSWTNSVYANNDGTHIEIYNIKVGGAGTGTATVKADVRIKKWGTRNVTMVVDLDPALDTV